jgi:hypothetical protein
MKFYMIRDTATDKWYTRSCHKTYWFQQMDATVWTTMRQAKAILERIKRQNAKDHRHQPAWKLPEPEIVVIDTNPQATPIPAIVIVRADDWKGLYLDGKLVEEGHRVDTIDVLKHLGIKAESVWANDEWLGDFGSLPEKLEEVVKEGEKW